MLLFFALFSWSVYLYIQLRDRPQPQDFMALAIHHKAWSQVWFSISTAFLTGGILYAIFHFAEVICHPFSGLLDNIAADDAWSNTLLKILPNLFAYSLFFVAWRWATGHFRAHWHNFITNSYRHSTIKAIEQLEARPRDKQVNFETVKALRILSALGLLLPPESAYTENEVEHGEGIKLEEIVRDLITKKGH